MTDTFGHARTAPLNVAPGSIVTVRDAEWLVTNTTPTQDGLLVEVTGLSELVRDTRAAFYGALDDIVPFEDRDAIQAEGWTIVQPDASEIATALKTAGKVN